MHESFQRARREAGYTLLEVMFAFVFATFFIGVSGGILGSAQGLSEEDRQRGQLLADHRRNFEYLTNVLRSADVTTLTGYDGVTGVATDLYFQRATGSTNGVRTLGPPDHLVWRPSPLPVSGIPYPGDVFLVQPGGEALAAARVPRDAFQVTQSGRTLAVRLTTYQPVAGTEALRVSSTVSVSVRN